MLFLTTTALLTAATRVLADTQPGAAAAAAPTARAVIRGVDPTCSSSLLPSSFRRHSLQPMLTRLPYNSVMRNSTLPVPDQPVEQLFLLVRPNNPNPFLILERRLL
jgi:hypothetical protein